MKKFSDDFLTDEDLIILIRSGNQTAMDMLCERYRYNAYKRAQHFLQAYDLPGLSAEDLAGEILLSFQNTLENFIIENGHFYPYWLSVTTHDMYDYAHYYLRMINAEQFGQLVSLDSRTLDGQSLSDFVGNHDDGLRAVVFNEDVRTMLLSRSDIGAKDMMIYDMLTNNLDNEEAIQILHLKRSSYYRRLKKLKAAIVDILK